MSEAVLLLGAIGLLYAHVGYGALLHGLARLTGRAAPRHEGFEDGQWPRVTVLISAFNEEGKLLARLENLDQLQYDRERLEILIVSDGSEDRTVVEAEEAARQHPELRVRIVEFTENQGRHAAQNLAAREAEGEIIVTSDADSEFAADFLRKIIAPFADPRVGVVGGEKVYRSTRGEIARSIGIYQKVEYWTRRGEDRWGLMAKTDGPCTAFLRRIWDEHEEFEDVDHSIVALAWKAGLIARHASDAVCYERPNEGRRQEIQARARMTRKGFLTIRKRWPLRNLPRRPRETFALYSHRHARYASPISLVLASVGLIWVSAERAGAGGAVLMAVAMVVSMLLPRSIPIVGRIAEAGRAFLVANWGFALGLVGVLRGDRSGRYRPTHGVSTRST